VNDFALNNKILPQYSLYSKIRFGILETGGVCMIYILFSLLQLLALFILGLINYYLFDGAHFGTMISIPAILLSNSMFLGYILLSDTYKEFKRLIKNLFRKERSLLLSEKKYLFNVLRSYQVILICIGVVGTFIGFIVMLSDLSSIDALQVGIAASLVTLYNCLIMAFILFLVRLRIEV
jgi:flagellar motor component MotA